MGDGKRLICDSAQVEERGRGVRFTIERDGEALPAFLVRYHGTVYAYVNRCAHIGIELDWAQGEFFDYSGLYLICSTHGATYLPKSGGCARGPCGGRGGLARVAVEESDGKIFLISEQ